VEAIKQVGPRVFNVHMKDLTSFTEKESQVEVGQGKMPVKKIFEALMGIGYADLWIWNMRLMRRSRCRA